MQAAGIRKKPSGRRFAVPALAAFLLGSWLWVGAQGRASEFGDTQWRQLVSRFREQRRPSRPPAVLAFAAADPAGSRAAPADDAASTADRPLRPTLDAELQQQRQSSYDVDANKSILDLQRFRLESQGEVQRADGVRGRAVLINLAPEANIDYLLQVSWEGEALASYHLTNVAPLNKDLQLAEEFPAGITLVDSQRTEGCSLWGPDASPTLQEARDAGGPYVSLCDGRLLLRLPSSGRKTTVERVTDFLRDNVWGGERITVFVRETFYRDAFVASGEVLAAEGAPSLGLSPPPPAAALAPGFATSSVVPAHLGLSLRGIDAAPLSVGQWYPVAGGVGIWFSAVQPRMLAPAILDGSRPDLTPLDEVELGALAYLVAFDLGQFEVGFALGTDHPRVDWSERVPESSRNAALPGPDGFDTVAPLVRTGIVPPHLLPRVAATFVGGFKRSHGAFKYGELATRNHSSHYGFIENGVVYSKLQPGLATLLITVDGDVQMRTWRGDDAALLPRLVAARQNGVAILERGAEETAAGVPAPLVTRWGAGNWSGSQDGRYRTLRAGACLVPGGERGFLVYGYFSGATPPAMARVFEGYGCSYAMLLDINALEHTYLATYRVAGDNVAVAHLIDGMSVLDKNTDSGTRPRFLAFSDNRDFFYVLRRSPQQVP